jgi:hypothetical protein
MYFIGESLIRIFYFCVALTIVLLGYSWLVTLDQDSEDFLYLAGIVKTVTDKKETQEEKVEVLTEWLSTNVIKTTEYPGWERDEYPEWFDDSSVASVIKGGIGNCGHQANNIITLSRYLGVRKHRRYSVARMLGSKYEHAFAELLVNGKPRVFDPNILIFQKNKDGETLSLQDMVENPAVVENSEFRKIVAEIHDDPSVVMTTNNPMTPEPLGQNSYTIYSLIGETATKMYLHLKNNPLTVLGLSWVIFTIISFFRESHLKNATPQNI